MELRNYQSEIDAAVKAAVRPVSAGGLGHTRVLVQLPTGGGKTIVFTWIAKGATGKGKTVWIIVHSQELLDQTCAKLRDFGVRHGVIRSGVPMSNSHVQVCMIQTLKNRLGKLLAPDIVIIDECHHTPASQYVMLLGWLPPSSLVLGFTATPERLDGKGLGAHYEHMVKGAPIKWLIDNGYLVSSVVYSIPKLNREELGTRCGDFKTADSEKAIDKPRIIGDIVQHYKKLADGLQAIVFAPSTASAEHIAQAYNDAGIPASTVDGKLDKEERSRRIAAFREERLRVLVNVQLATEGVDIPGIECVIIARPTASRALHTQIAGRGLRTNKEKGKTHCVIIDHVGNCRTFGPPEWDYPWSLAGRTGLTKDEEDKIKALKTCEECFCFYEGAKCPLCGTDAPKNGRRIEQVDGELVLFSGDPAPKRKFVNRDELSMLRGATNLAEVTMLCEELGITIQVAGRILRENTESLSGLLKVENIMGYARGWAHLTYEKRHGKEGLQEAVQQLMRRRVEQIENGLEVRHARENDQARRA